MTVDGERATGGQVRSSRRRLAPDDRRREVLYAAMRVLRERGPAGCRVEDITAEAGTAKGNFYRYFPTWDDLLIAVRDQLLDSYGEDLARRYADLDQISWWEVVDEEIDHFIAFQLDLGGLHEAVFHGPSALARPAERGRSAAAILAQLLTAGIAEGSFAEVDVDATATLLFDLLHGAVDAIASGMNQAEVIRTTHRIVHRTLEPDPGRGSTLRPS